MAYDLTDKIYNDWTVLYECERPKGVKTKDTIGFVNVNVGMNSLQKHLN